MEGDATVTGAQWVHAVLAMWFGIGALLTIMIVGKPRKPITGGQAAITVLVQSIIITALLVWWPS